MKHTAILFFVLFASFVNVGATDAEQLAQAQTVHLATALEHITVLQFGEPVTLAAAGSSAFNIEWRENIVLIKPLKPGASSDLFVWTGSKRYAYELDPPGEAKNMNYAIDNPNLVKASVPPTDSDARMLEVADMVLTRAFLGVDQIENHEIKSEKGHMIVRVESVFQSASSLYIRCTIENRTTQPYRVLKPSLYELLPPQTAVSLTSLRRTQLDARGVQKLGELKRNPLATASAQIAQEDLAPGETTRSVIVLRRQFTAPSVLEITFANAGDRNVSATFVF